MHIFHDLNEWRDFRNTLNPNQVLGFAPTMGNLHPGHLSLFKHSKENTDVTVSSLFINPTQFNRPDDYSNYPRTLENDLELMEKTGVDFCILPNQEAIYPDNYSYQIHELEFGKVMEGKYRPGHFHGVLTIVMKLLSLVRPNKAYFGEKDYQQYLLIKGMANAFFMNIDIKPLPTIRENSGLAFSSRNNRLNLEERQLAEKFAKIFHQDQACEKIEAELNDAGIVVEYIEEHQNRRFIAVMIGNIRLIDNYLLT